MKGSDPYLRGAARQSTEPPLLLAPALTHKPFPRLSAAAAPRRVCSRPEQLDTTNMFTTLASYLRGGLPSSAEPDQEVSGAVTAQVRLTAVDADDDWVLVDKTTDVEECSGSDEDEEYSCAPSLEVAISAIPAILHPTERQLPPTRSSSASSLPYLSLEESWFVTPPPCFTSEGPVHMETSPLENLLIEHPSMSVYQHTSAPCFQLPNIPCQSHPGNTAPLSPTPSASSSVSLHEEEVVQENTAIQPRPERRQAVYSLQQQQKQNCTSIRSAQKLRQRRAGQALKRNHLERSNKAREINSRNKLKRRSDHMLNHSGANNNRKC